MRGKPAAAAPSFGERFRLPGAAAISSVFFCFSTAKSRRQPFHPVTRAAACGSYPHLFFCRAHLAKKKRPSIIHFLLLFAVEKQQKPLRPVTRAAACGSYPHLFFCRAHLAKKKRPSIIHFLLLFAVEKQQKPLRPVTRAAACGPRAASGNHAGLQANRPRRFPHPGLRLLLRPCDTAGGISLRLKQENKRPKKPPDASRIRACDCRFALVTQPEASL